MNHRERSIVIGCVLGDGFLQKVGEKSARLRLEHSVRQKEYLLWKEHELKRFMQKPVILSRTHPTWKKCYQYIRCQSHSSPLFGKLRMMFYPQGKKIIPVSLPRFMNPLALAVWFMDDGYYYRRDKTAYLYLSPLSQDDIDRLLELFRECFGIHPRFERKKTGALDFKFPVSETKKLMKIIAPQVIPSLRYKLGEEPRID